MKKLLSILVVLTMLCAPMAISVSAAADYQLSMNSVEATHGDEVVIEVSLDTNPGIWGAIFEVVYDPAYFDLVSAENGEIFQDVTMAEEPDDSGSFRYFGMAVGTENVKGDPTGVIVKFTFKVLKTAPAGIHTIDIYIPDDGDGYFLDATDLDKKISVELTKKGSITVTGTPSVEDPDETTDSGSVDTDKDEPVDTTPDTFVPPPTVWPDNKVETDTEKADETTKAPVQTTPVTDADGSTVEETTSLGEPVSPEETKADVEYVTEYETDAEGDLVLDDDGKPKTIYREVIRGNNNNKGGALIFIIAGVVAIIAVAVIASVIVVKKKK